MHSHVGADSNQQMQFDSYHHLLIHRHLFAQSNSNSIISGKCNTMQQQAATSPSLPSWSFPCKAVEELKFGDIAAATTNGWELNHNISNSRNSVEVENSANGKKTEEEGDDKLNVDGHVESSAEGGAGLVSAAPGLSIPMPFNDDDNAPLDDHGIFSGCSQSPLPDDAVLAALQKFLPSNVGGCPDDDVDGDIWPALDAYACDEFRMYEFKVRKCVRGRSHDWTECPFAHPGEKARRRDPRRYHYSGTACPDFRKGGCRKGESCEYAHGVFECWLHPARYRTQPCKDGRNCRRRVCFFAHTPEQLRVVPAGFSGGGGESPPHPAAGGGGTPRASLLLKAAAAMSGGAYDGSPLRRALAASLDASVALELILEEGSHSCPTAAAANICSRPYLTGCCQASPTSTLIGHQTFCPSPLTPTSSPSPSSSPPLSPTSPQPIWSPSSVIGAAVPAHRRHLDRLRSMPSISIPAFYDDTPCYIPSPQVPSVQAQDMMNSPRTMAELISSLQQQLHLKAHNSACDAAANPVMCCSDSRLTPMSLWAMQQQAVYPSRSAPVTPKSRYGSSGHQPVLMKAVHHPPAAITTSTTNCTIEPSAAGPSPHADMRMESGWHLSAKICTKLTQDRHQSSAAPVPENDTPDFGWVNELVQ